MRVVPSLPHAPFWAGAYLKAQEDITIREQYLLSSVETAE